MKKQVMTSIDAELHEEAKKKRLNISEILENAIRERLNKTEVLITEAQKCEFCGKEMEKATRKELKGLTWLYPDEKWICPSCLRNAK